MSRSVIVWPRQEGEDFWNAYVFEDESLAPDHIPELAIDAVHLRSYDDLQLLLDRHGLARSDIQPGPALTQMQETVGPWHSSAS
jgi:hypothetical protein